jgi:hypothetical protein
MFLYFRIHLYGRLGDSRTSRAWHRVGLIWQMEDAAAISWPCEPAASAMPDDGGVIVFSSLQERPADGCPGIQLPDLRVGT